jgi:hypothetical protein
MPVTYFELLRELEWQFGIVLLTDTLRHIIRRIPGCKTIVAVPQEASRIIYDEHEIDEYYSRLEAVITGVPAAIVYNVDEAGFDSWVDASRIAVVVPAEATGSEIAVPQTTLELELYESGFPPESCHIVHQENGFVTSRLFEDWLENILVSDVIAQRQRLGWEGRFSLFLMVFLETLQMLLKKTAYSMELSCWSSLCTLPIKHSP